MNFKVVCDGVRVMSLSRTIVLSIAIYGCEFKSFVALVKQDISLFRPQVVEARFGRCTQSRGTCFVSSAKILLVALCLVALALCLRPKYC